MNRIRELRTKLGLTQFELSTKLKILPNRFSQWERGERVPRPEKLKELADFFGVTVDYLMGYGDDSASYYRNPEVEKYAERIHKDPRLRMLFDASKGLSKKSIDEVVKFIQYQHFKESGGVDQT